MRHSFGPKLRHVPLLGKKTDMKPEQPRVNIEEAYEKELVNKYSPPSALVNEKGVILYIHGHSGRYLEHASGKATLNIFEIARNGLKLKLTSAFYKALERKKEIYEEEVEVKINGSAQMINLLVRPFPETHALSGLIMVTFEEMPNPKILSAKKSVQLTGKSAMRLKALESELALTKKNLQSTIEEHEASDEELKSLNEEMQSTNEEMQSTNEELETSKEELQSVNEELVTVNAELQSKIEELSSANNDLNNLFSSTKIATVFLDQELCIKRFTPAAAELMNFIPADKGRPFLDIASNLDYPDLDKDAREVLKTLVFIEKEVRDKTGAWYLMSIRPYRTLDNVIDGLVITFVDITGMKKMRDSIKQSEFKFRSFFNNQPSYCYIVAGDCTILDINRAALRALGYKQDELIGKPLKTIYAPESL